MTTRYRKGWKHPDYRADAPLDARLRLLVERATEPDGNPQDLEAVGRYVRDRDVANRTPEQAAITRRHRSQNEGLNAELKTLPLAPTRSRPRKDPPIAEVEQGPR